MSRNRLFQELNAKWCVAISKRLRSTDLKDTKKPNQKKNNFPIRTEIKELQEEEKKTI